MSDRRKSNRNYTAELRLSIIRMLINCYPRIASKKVKAKFKSRIEHHVEHLLDTGNNIPLDILEKITRLDHGSI